MANESDDTNRVSKGPAIRLMLATPGIARRDITRTLKVSRQLVHYHARRVEQQGGVVRTGTTGRGHSVCTRPVVASKTSPPEPTTSRDDAELPPSSSIEPLAVPVGTDPMDRDGRFNAGPTRCGRCRHYLPPETGWSHFCGVDDEGNKNFDHICIGSCISAVTVARRLLSRHVRRTWLPKERR